MRWRGRCGSGSREWQVPRQRARIEAEAPLGDASAGWTLAVTLPDGTAMRAWRSEPPPQRLVTLAQQGIVTVSPGP